MATTQAPPRAAVTGSEPYRRVSEPMGGRLGPLMVGQLVAIEVAAVAVLAALDQPVWLLGAVGVAVLLLLVAVFARRGRRWWFEDLVLRRRFRDRRRSAATAAAGGGEVVLRPIEPSLSVIEVVDRSTRFGLGQDDGGWFVAFAVGPATSDHPDWIDARTVDRVARVLAESTAPVSALQLVSHTFATYDARRAVTAGRRLWIAARLRANDASAEAAGRGGGIEGVHRTLAATVGRLGKALQAAGLRHQVLDSDSLRAVIAAVAGVDASYGAPAEAWTDWRSGPVSHVCHRLGLPPNASVGLLADALTRTGALSHTIALLLDRDRDRSAAAGQSLLRVGSTADRAAETQRQVSEVVRAGGASLRRLDGEHALGVYAVAPTAAEAAAAARSVLTV
jgi:type VII secretion protein EccE